MTDNDSAWVSAISKRCWDALSKVSAAEERIRQLEKHIHYPYSTKAGAEIEGKLNVLADRVGGLEHRAGAEPFIKETTLTAMKEAAARAQATEAVPMRSDVETIRTMTAFIKRLIDREDFAYAVTLEVRNEARRALGIKEREV